MATRPYKALFTRDGVTGIRITTYQTFDSAVRGLLDQWCPVYDKDLFGGWLVIVSSDREPYGLGVGPKKSVPQPNCDQLEEK